MTRRTPPSMRPDNMPQAPAAAEPAAPATAAPAPTNAVASVSPLPPRYLGRSDETDSQRSGGSGGVSIPLSRLVARRALDPDLDLVNRGFGIPRYLDKALDVTVLLFGGRKQEIVAAALRAYLDPEIVAEARRATGA